MGQGASRENSEPRAAYDGIRITPDLLAQLEGRPLPSRQASSRAPGPGGMLQALRPRLAPPGGLIAQQQQEEENATVARALERSRRVGNMLIAREDEEMQQIESLANELINREQNIPSAERPCGDEASACLQCYQENAQDPTACAASVEAYSQCARQISSQQQAV